MDLEEDFKRAYPNLAEELEASEGIPMEGRRAEGDEALEGELDEIETPADGDTEDRTPEEDWEPARIPTVEDHLRRCESLEEAQEIIDYFYEKGEIDGGEASLLEDQIEEIGLRAFGPRREPGSIERDGLD